jgi:hypothetical protein
MAQEGGAETTEETPPPKSETESSALPSDQAIAHNAVACLESTVGITTQTKHRPAATSSATRVGVSMSKYQRVYVDTPHIESQSNPADKQAVVQSGQEVSIASVVSGQALSQKFNSRFSEALQGPFTTAKTFGYWLSWPVRFICSGPLWLCSHFWDAILTLDEWLESFLRCLFLLEPSKRIRRR